MKKRIRRRALTLLEIMIVILLIGLISGVVSYNLRGTLDKGKAFRSEQGARRLEDILNLEIQMGHVAIEELLGETGIKEQEETLLSCIENSGLVSNKEAPSFAKDGWNKPYKLEASEDGESIVVSSLGLEEYRRKHTKERELSKSSFNKKENKNSRGR